MLASRTAAPVQAQPASPARASRVLNAVADRVVLFRAGDFIFVTYGVVAGAGAFVALFWMSLLLLGLGVSQFELAMMLLAGASAVVVLSRLAVLALDLPQLVRDPVTTMRKAAFASWGGILALALTPIVFSWVTGHALLPLMDAIVLAALVGHAIGRVGCLTYGCCHGRPTAFRMAITYNDPAAKAVRVSGLKGTPLHAAPLYEAGLIIALLALAGGLALAGVPQGVPAATYLLLYGAGRLAIEFTRDNRGRRIAGPFAVNHLLALAMSTGGAALMLIVLSDPSPMRSMDTGAALPKAIELAPLMAVASLIVLIGFSLQRNRVGEW